MQAAALLMQECGLKGLQWAFDDQLYAASSSTWATLADYAALMKTYDTR